MEEDNNVIYSPERYDGEMLLDVARYKGSTGAVKLTWGVTMEPNTPASFIVSPVFGQLEFAEGQWNSSIHLRFPSIPALAQKIGIFVKLFNASGGAMLGNFSSVKIIFPPNINDSKVVKDNGNKTGVNLEILLPCLGGALLIIGLIAVICLSKGRKR